MTEFANPWQRPPEAPPPLRSPPSSGWTRTFGWACAASVVLGVPGLVADNLAVVLLRQPAIAVVVADGAIDAPPLPGPYKRVALRFTAGDGREITGFVPIAPWPIGGPSPAAGTEVPVRYDPRDPAARVTRRGAGEAALRILGALLGGWLMLSWSVRVGRGASGSARGTFWPPWPFGR